MMDIVGARYTVEEGVAIDGVPFATKIVTAFGDEARATTLIHTTDRDLRIGGVRIVERGTLTELASLALGMSVKSRAVGLPIDGLKCLLELGSYPDWRIVPSLLRTHIHHVRAHDDAVCFGPDMNCSGALLGGIAAEDPIAGRHVTGTTPRDGGVGINEIGLTAAGVAAAVGAVMDAGEVPEGATVGVQGVGAVGRAVLPMLADRGFSVGVVANVAGTLVGNPLDARILHDQLVDQGDDALPGYADRFPDRSRLVPDPTHFFDRPMDVCIPAARTRVLATPAELDHVRRENSDVRDGIEFAERARVWMVVEAANAPLTPALEAAYTEAGIVVLPDVLINGGGFVGCWAEARCRRAGLRCDGVPGIDVAAACLEHTKRSAIRNTETVLQYRAVETPRATVDRIVGAENDERLGPELNHLRGLIGG